MTLPEWRQTVLSRGYSSKETPAIDATHKRQSDKKWQKRGKWENLGILLTRMCIDFITPRASVKEVVIVAVVVVVVASFLTSFSHMHGMCEV